MLLSAVRDVPSDRQCRGHEGRVRPYPHDVWEYPMVKAFRDDPNRHQPAVAGARKHCWPDEHLRMQKSLYLAEHDELDHISSTSRRRRLITDLRIRCRYYLGEAMVKDCIQMGE